MDLKELKQRIHEEERIEELLEYIGCHNIKLVNDRYEAARPDGDNKRSIQVKNNEALSTSIRSQGIEGIDIYGLVAYIVYKCETEDERKKYLYESKKWICSKLGYSNNRDSPIAKEIVKDDYEVWLLEQKRKIALKHLFHNEILPEIILDEYVPYPWKGWIDEGISYETQVLFNIGFDIKSERVTVPIHNIDGKLIGIKGRFVGFDESIPKYLFLYKCNKSSILFNYHRALPHILERDEVIVFESEKSCMKATGLGFPNCIAIGGDSISEFQRELLQGMNVEIILAYDKDKTLGFAESQASVFKDGVSIIYDKYNLLDVKSSPVDQQLEVWNKLYENRL